MRAVVPALAAVAVLLVMPAAALAQSGVTELSIGEIDDSRYPTVEVPVTVPAELGPTPLAADAFALSEDDSARDVYLGESPEIEESPPPSVVLALDVSGSMRGSIEEAKQAATRFIEALPQGSRVGLVTFGDRADLVVPPTANARAVGSRIEGLTADDDLTSLYAGVERAAQALPVDSGGPTSVLVLSDGDDTAGEVTEEQALRAVDQAGVQVLAIALGDDIKRAALDNLAGPDGQVVAAADAGQLEQIFTGFASELAGTYVLRYESEASGTTELTVAVTSGSFYGERTTVVELAGTPAAVAPPPRAPAPVAVANDAGAVPLLGTTPALVSGVTALAAGALTLLLVILLPQRRRPTDRLLLTAPTAHAQTARLTAIAQWTTQLADQRLRQGSLGTRLDKRLEAAGLNLRSSELVVTVLSGVFVAFLLGSSLVSPLVGLLLAVVPIIAARLWLSVRADRRRSAFADQLIDVLQLVGSSLRAGYGLTQGIDAVSRDAEEPAMSEFRRIILEHRFGRDLNEAMDNCAERMDNDDFRWVVQAIGIHRDVGGDLSTVLDNIVATIRDRADVQRQVRTLSAEGRMSARVLTALPILVLVLLLVMSPGYIGTLTSEPFGIALLALAGVLMLTGIAVVQRMANIKY